MFEMDLFFIQLIGMTAVGGFAGEWWRSQSCSNAVAMSRFLANVLAGGFLSFLSGWALYERMDSPGPPLITAGLIAFQSVENIMKTTKKLVLSHLKLIEAMLGNGKEGK